MDFQNTPESVNSVETPPASTEPFRKDFHVSNEKFAYNADAICDNTVGTNCKKESNSHFRLSEDDSTFQDVNGETEQISTSDQSRLNFIGVVEQAENCINCKVPVQTLRNKIELSDTDSCDNLEHSNDSDAKSRLSNESTVEEEPIETATLEPSDDAAVTTSYKRRTRRNSKRKRDADECCPVCGVTVRLPELEGHFSKEVENLSKIPKSLKKTKAEDKGISTTFVQVKSNRENRLSAKVARYAAKDRNEIHCPVCNLKMRGSQGEINKHVLNCINEDESSDELVVVDEDSFEEYEFADQIRVRAISFVPGGYKSLHGVSSKHKTTDDDEELNVDVDDTMAFGKPQYTEMDVIHSTTDLTQVKELEELRKAVLFDPSIQPHVLECRKWVISDGDESKNTEPTRSTTKEDFIDLNIPDKRASAECNNNPGDEQSSHIVSSLKEKIKDLEEQSRNVKCLICLEPYTKPVVSTTCWHVHCEECWLMTMGVKKLCPQCNMIVFPSDLRQIYL